MTNLPDTKNMPKGIVDQTMFKFYAIDKVDIIDCLIGEKASIKLPSAFNLNDNYELKFNLDIDLWRRDTKNNTMITILIIPMRISSNGRNMLQNTMVILGTQNNNNGKNWLVM